jgi:hypothetical protein
MAGLYSAVILSKEPITSNILLPKDTQVLNYVSTFENAEGLHKSRLASLEDIATPYFFWLDVDDPVPEKLVAPTKGLVYGDYLANTCQGQILVKEVYGDWVADFHKVKPLFIHKAICSTAKARAIAKLLPRGEYWTEWLLYYFLALKFGATYDPELKFIWNKQQSGMHGLVHKATQNSLLWILQNEKRILNLTLELET